MNYRKITLIFVLLTVLVMQFCNGLHAQTKKISKADEAYNEFAFIEAAKLYREEIKKGNDAVDLYTKLGNCYYYNANYKEAADCYSNIINSTTNVDFEYYFRYAQALNNIQEYKEAEFVMKKYYEKAEKKDLSSNWNEKKLLDEIKKQSGRYNIKAVNINSPFSDFGAAIYDKNKIIYASAKDTGIIFKRKHNWNEKSFLKLYSAEITVDGGLQNPVRLKGEINTKYHQSSPVITKDGKLMYFTRNNYLDKKLKADKNGTAYLKIYSAENINGEWKNIKELPFPVNSDGYSSAHPALSPDETELYFVSDRNNKFGDSDLYVVSLKKNGLIGKDVRKLGDEINTLGRETFPYVDDSGVLYFSSDGHPGLGGLDVFAAIKDNKGDYHVVNVGEDINSSSDDFAYVYNSNTKTGYFSSNRSGNDDIYCFTENRPIDFNFNNKPVLSGLVKYYSTGVPIEGVIVEVYNEASEKLETLYTNKEGKYSIALDPYLKYKLVYKKSGLIEKTQLVQELKPDEKREYIHEFLDELAVPVGNVIKQVAEGNDLTHILDLNPIYFDYSGYKIRESSKLELDKIVEFMKERPNVSIKVNSHTDSRGRDEFNMKLSENRARATVDYLVEKGINEARLTGQGYGETRLINRCSNGVKCSELEHQANRRSEFIVHINN